MLELLEYICNLHSGIRPDLFKAGKSKYDSESLAKLLADENRITFVAADENDEGARIYFLHSHRPLR